MFLTEESFKIDAITSENQNGFHTVANSRHTEYYRKDLQNIGTSKLVQETLQENFEEISNKPVNLEQQISIMEILNGQYDQGNKILSVYLDRLQKYTRRNNVGILGQESDHPNVKSSVIKILNDTLKL